MFGDAIRILVSPVVAVEVPLSWASCCTVAILYSYNYAVIDTNFIFCGLDVRPLHENRVPITKSRSVNILIYCTNQLTESLYLIRNSPLDLIKNNNGLPCVKRHFSRKVKVTHIFTAASGGTIG